MRAVPLLLALLVGALTLAGCARRADRDQAAICRTAAAGLATPVRIRVTAQTPLAQGGEPGVRLALVPEDPDVALPWLECRFRDGTSPPELTGLNTPAGAVDETHLILLKRFWLGAEEEGQDPGLDEGTAAALPTLPFGVAYLLQHLVDALPDAAVYGLLAAAYSLVYGLHGRINLAFGEIAAVGGLAAVAGAALLRDATPAALLGVAAALAVWAAGLHGVALERLVMWPLRAASAQRGLVATVGAALALREYLRLVTGAQPRWVPPILDEPLRLAQAGEFVVTVTPMALLLAGAAACASGGLLAMFRFSAFGRDWRATADDPVAAALVGVDPGALSRRSYALAAALVGAAGAGVTLNYGGVGFDYTTGLGLKALVAAILGGIGSVPGAFLGGIAIAAAEGLWSAYYPIGDRDLAIDVLLVAVLVVRPGGFFGERDPQAAAIGLRRT